MLVDTSVWIDHFRRTESALAAALDRGDVHCHDFVIGELACGTLARRDEVLTLLQAVPRLPAVLHRETMAGPD
jgi:predicted nucleic acid-binding protein